MYPSFGGLGTRNRYRLCRVELPAEGFLQGSEPGFEIAPLLDRLTIDRATHLLTAWRRHDAIRLPKPQATLLERQATIVQHPADLGFRVVNEPFVLYEMDASREDRLPVFHHRRVAVVIP